MDKHINIVFPHQLFKESPLTENGYPIYLIEEFLFFKQYAFHKQKIAFHRASMKAYQNYLSEKDITVYYINAWDEQADIRNFEKEIKNKSISNIHVIDPCDFYLEKRLRQSTKKCKLYTYDSPLFINTKNDLNDFFKKEKNSFFQTTFYKQQRKKHKILINSKEKPEGGKWTFDKENRKKYPKSKTPPNIYLPESTAEWKEALTYVNTHYKSNPGELDSQPIFPVNFKQANDWFQQFLDYRFYDFGAYEDAIVKEHVFLNHSILSPLINVGLLHPKFVIDESVLFAKRQEIPINSTEGFVRQILGWREFTRGMYLCKGSFSRTKNFWNFTRKIPSSFYNGTTGIAPIDQTIKHVLKTSYCHHIERLMILGNFMLLCEFDPNEVYRWFMELFIDAYDWVMVPNVYGMSQFADGGIFATKPYISSSNYVKKMSNYNSDEWCATWDGLFWRFVDKQQDFFKSNPRLSMMYYTLNNMSNEKRKKHFENAESFLQSIE